MRLKTLITLFILVPSALFSQSLPSYQETVKYFFEHYSHERDYSRSLGFARKKGGWYVQLTDKLNHDSVVEKQLFRSRGTANYIPLKGFKAAQPDAAKNALQFINGPDADYMAYGYDRCYYYGYNGWDADMIADFGNRKITNDTLLEGLGRAYSAYASRYLWYQYGGHALSKDPLQKPLGRLEMPSEERVQKMKAYFSKALACYGQLFRKNPSYSTILGRIGMKYFSETYHTVMQFRMCNREDEARKMLNLCRLLPDDSATAANFLNAALKNAIIFTYGDNDTYPLLYLQEKYQVRQDVTVINTSLLGLSAYLQLLQRNKAVTFTTTAAEFGKKTFDYAYQHSEKDTLVSQSIDEFLNSYRHGPKLINEGDSIPTYPANDIFFTIDRTRFAGGVKNGGEKDILHIEPDKYMAMNDLITLDIIRENMYERPILFSTETPHLFETYVVPQGPLYLLGSGEEAAIKYDLSTGIAAMESFLKDHYILPFANLRQPSAEYDNYVSYHVGMYHLLADYYTRIGNGDKAITLLQQCFSVFGKKMPYTINAKLVIQLLYKNKLTSLGDGLSVAYLQGLQNKYFNKKAGYTYDVFSGSQELSYINHILNTYQRKIPEAEKISNRLSGIARREQGMQ